MPSSSSAASEYVNAALLEREARPPSCSLRRPVSSRRNTSMNVDRSARLTLITSDLRCGGVQRAVVSLAGGLQARGHRISVLTFAPAETDFFRLPQAIVRSSLGTRKGTADPATAAAADDTGKAESAASGDRRDRTRRRDITRCADQCPDAAGAARSGGSCDRHRARRRFGPAGHWPSPGYGRSGCGIACAAFVIPPHSRWSASVRQSIATLHGYPMLAEASFTTRLRRSTCNPCQCGCRGDSRRTVRGLRAWGACLMPKALMYCSTHSHGLLRAFPEWQLVIIGDGELHGQLHRQAGELIANDRVVFAGALTEPFALLQQAEFFVMASRYEGFPMAHGEALACGLPVIATDCPSRPLRRGERGNVAGGVRELVRDGVDGFARARARIPRRWQVRWQT